MRIVRTAARAGNFMEYSVNLEDPAIELGESSGTPIITIKTKDVENFGDARTYHDYEARVAMRGILLMIDALRSAKGDAKGKVKEVVSPNLSVLIRLVNMCAEWQHNNDVLHGE